MYKGNVFENFGTKVASELGMSTPFWPKLRLTAENFVSQQFLYAKEKYFHGEFARMRCEDTCVTDDPKIGAGNGLCEDGAYPATDSVCKLGTDCSDCFNLLSKEFDLDWPEGWIPETLTFFRYADWIGGTAVLVVIFSVVGVFIWLFQLHKRSLLFLPCRRFGAFVASLVGGLRAKSKSRSSVDEAGNGQDAADSDEKTARTLAGIAEEEDEGLGSVKQAEPDVESPPRPGADKLRLPLPAGEEEAPDRKTAGRSVSRRRFSLFGRGASGSQEGEESSTFRQVTRRDRGDRSKNMSIFARGGTRTIGAPLEPGLRVQKKWTRGLEMLLLAASRLDMDPAELLFLIDTFAGGSGDEYESNSERNVNNVMALNVRGLNRIVGKMLVNMCARAGTHPATRALHCTYDYAHSQSSPHHLLCGRCVVTGSCTWSCSGST